MTPAPRTTAQEQLERLLYVIPAAARHEGVRIADLAAALDVAPEVVLRDLREATARSFHQPAGAVETFTVFTDGRRVWVRAVDDFHRPVRLTDREALALGLGLRALAAEADGAARDAILALATRLEKELAVPDIETVRELRERGAAGPDPAPEYEPAVFAAFDDDGFRGVVADAIEQGRTCELWYFRPGDDAPQHRRVAPWRLLYAEGMWYVAAHDLQRDGLRIFRMDRVLDAALLEEAAPPVPADVDGLLHENGAYIAADDIEVSVRYSSRIARWIIERHGDAGIEADGSVVIRHRVADPRWIVRHVLQYGGEAVIEEPAPARTWVSAAVAAFG